jgi:AcrR family transcriptional regulator
MTEGTSEDDANPLPTLQPERDPSLYQRKAAKVRFAIAKYYGLGSDGEWTVVEIADALDVSKRTVYRYLSESEMAKEVEEVLAVTEAEWRLDLAIKLRQEVERLEQIEQELLQRKTTVATDFETKSVQGTPTGDRNIRLPDDTDTYKLKLPVPTDFETVTDYGPDLESVQKEKRQYLDKIADLLGLDAADRKEVDHTLASKHEEVKVVEIRDTDDPYPEVDPIEASDGTEDVRDEIEIEVESTANTVAEEHEDTTEGSGS